MQRVASGQEIYAKGTSSLVIRLTACYFRKCMANSSCKLALDGERIIDVATDFPSPTSSLEIPIQHTNSTIKLRGDVPERYATVAAAGAGLAARQAKTDSLPAIRAIWGSEWETSLPHDLLVISYLWVFSRSCQATACLGRAKTSMPIPGTLALPQELQEPWSASSVRYQSLGGFVPLDDDCAACNAKQPRDACILLVSYLYLSCSVLIWLLVAKAT